MDIRSLAGAFGIGSKTSSPSWSLTGSRLAIYKLGRQTIPPAAWDNWSEKMEEISPYAFETEGGLSASPELKPVFESGPKAALAATLAKMISGFWW